MINNKNIKSKLLITFLSLPIVLIVLLKVVANGILGIRLINLMSVSQLLPLSEVALFNQEFLFKLAIAFSDFNFNLNSFFRIISIVDVLPILLTFLVLEVNRITLKNVGLKKSLIFFLFLYFLKYIGLVFILFITVSLNLEFSIAFNYLGYWMIIVYSLFIASISFLIYSLIKSYKK